MAASTFAYSYFDYIEQPSSSNGNKYKIRVHTAFSHETPSATLWVWKLKYWFYDVTAGETSDPTGHWNDNGDQWLIEFFTQTHVGERQTHDLVYEFYVTPGHTYYTNAQIWYTQELHPGEGSEGWTASSLKMGKTRLNIKSDTPTPTISPPYLMIEKINYSNLSDIDIDLMQFKFGMCGVENPTSDEPYNYRVVMWFYEQSQGSSNLTYTGDTQRTIEPNKVYSNYHLGSIYQNVRLNPVTSYKWRAKLERKRQSERNYSVIDDIHCDTGVQYFPPKFIGGDLDTDIKFTQARDGSVTATFILKWEADTMNNHYYQPTIYLFEETDEEKKEFGYARGSMLKVGDGNKATFNVKFSGLKQQATYLYYILVQSGNSSSSMQIINYLYPYDGTTNYFGSFTTPTYAEDDPNGYIDLIYFRPKTATSAEYSAKFTATGGGWYAYYIEWWYKDSGNYNTTLVSSRTHLSKNQFLMIEGTIPNLHAGYVGLRVHVMGGLDNSGNPVLDLFETTSQVVYILIQGETPQSPLLKWSWEFAAGSWNATASASADSTQVNNAYTAITEGTATTNFHHNVWNDLITWITDNSDERQVVYENERVQAAKMTTEPYILTAEKYNHLTYIYNKLLDEGLNGTQQDFHMSQKNRGDPVLGIFFTSLTDNMNSKIDTYNNSLNSG